MPPSFHAHPSAVIDEPCSIGAGTRIWHFCHICENAVLGENCNLGQNVMIAAGVRIGRNVKIQNNVSLYSGTVIEDDVFLGPSCVLTNISNPRSQIVRRGIYESTVIRRGATIGANATIVCGTTLGRYCLIAAGAVVTRNVPDYTLIAGVPGKRRGWVSRHGHPLREPAPDGVYTCPESKLRYRETEPGILRCLDLDEEAPLPPELATGLQPFRNFTPRG
jgi:UDP-2-acetamido-3-amino-2,3-dideoxy-glucuronate N-acetyltransferase